MKILYSIIALITIIFAQELSIDSNKTIIIYPTENNDSLNFCLALSKKDLKYCSNIQNKDEKSACFGILQRNTGHCSTIVDKNTQNRCLSIALSDINYCKKITDKNKKNSCTLFYLKYESDQEQEDTCEAEKK